MFRYPDPTPVMPYLHGFSVRKRILTTANVQASVSGKEVQVLTQAFPLWEFELTYEGLRSQTGNLEKYLQYSGMTEYEAISTVFLMCKGQYGRFYFSDPSDCSRQGQQIGVGTGAETKFRLVRTVGAGDFTFWDPVGGLDERIPATIYVDGVAQSDWSILPDKQTIELVTPPPLDSLVTADFYFYFYCRFLEDVQNFEEFMKNLHTLNSLTFRSTKDTDVDTPNPYFLGYAV